MPTDIRTISQISRFMSWAHFLINRRFGLGVQGVTYTNEAMNLVNWSSVTLRDLLIVTLPRFPSLISTQTADLEIDKISELMRNGKRIGTTRSTFVCFT